MKYFVAAIALLAATGAQASTLIRCDEFKSRIDKADDRSLDFLPVLKYSKSDAFPDIESIDNLTNIKAAIKCGQLTGQFERLQASLEGSAEADLKRWTGFTKAAVMAADPKLSDGAALEFVKELQKRANAEAEHEEVKNGAKIGRAAANLGGLKAETKIQNGIVSFSLKETE